MSEQPQAQQFSTLFRKYRLKSEIETLVEFGDLLATEGLAYETSIFTRWQSGERIPRDRHVILTIIHLFIKRKGITILQEANMLLESAGHGYVTETEHHCLHRSIEQAQRSFFSTI